MELPATNDGEWRRRRSLQSHKGGTWTVFFRLTCQSLVQGVVQASSRWGVQSHRNHEHAQGADAVSTGPQQARNTEGSERTARSTSVKRATSPRATHPKTSGRPSQKMAGTSPRTGRLHIFMLANIGSVLTARLFGVPPVDTSGVVGNVALIHQYVAYTSSGSLRMRCRRGYADVTFPPNRDTHDRSGCSVPFDSTRSQVRACEHLLLRSGPRAWSEAGDSHRPDSLVSGPRQCQRL